MTDSDTRRYFIALDPDPSAHRAFQSKRQGLQMQLSIIPERAKVPAHVTAKAPFEIHPSKADELWEHFEELARCGVLVPAKGSADEPALLDEHLVYLVAGDEVAGLIEQVIAACAFLGIDRNGTEGKRPHLTLARILDDAERRIALGEFDGVPFVPNPVVFSRLVLYERREERWSEVRDLELAACAA